MNRKERRASGAHGATPARYSSAVAPKPGTLADLFAAAVAQHQAGALAQAERQYLSILALYPDHTDSLHNLGLLALHSGNPSSAVERIGKAIAINDRVAEYHYNIALAHRALGRADEVAAHLERAVDLRGDHALAHLNLGNVRREQGRLAEAAVCYEHVLALNPKFIAARLNLANLLSEQGRWDEATACFEQVLSLDPNHAETHYHLAAALIKLGKTSDAIRHFETAVVAKPDLPGAYESLGAAYIAVAKWDMAVHAIGRALEMRETPQSKLLFAQCIKYMQFTGENPRLRPLVLRALTEGWARPRELANVCMSLIKLNGTVNSFIARANAAWPGRLTAAELLGTLALATLAHDELLIYLLQRDPVTDIGLERLLTNVRHAMLACANDEREAGDDQHLKFFAAVARHCFTNEYVYALPQSETDQVRNLQAKLTQAIAANASIPPLWPITLGAYFPLHALPGAEALLDRSWPEHVNALLVQQIREPARERQIAATLPRLTAIEDEVSSAVRQQYEQNPYPRWTSSGPPIQPAILKDAPPGSFDVLVAGCGTGLSTSEFARQMLNARILAIDLSLASLSYAKRMAESFGLTNVEFGQADIMELASINRQFDFIDVSGVLHHLADPWAGWRVLLSLLRPGGTMQVGLYSELARQNVVAARALIDAHGYRASPEDIRRCREYIVTTDDPMLKSLSLWTDFFTISECRDLLFHVQEHRMTLPEIKTFLTATDLEFAGFLPEPSILQRFTARFPDRSALLDLDCWHSLETEAPGTFAGMYQFWVRKPAA